MKELGSGQFGVVKSGLWRGRTPVAIKMLQAGKMSEDDFLSEAEIMKRFDHPNLVKLLAICSRERPLYIVTELMENGCLLDYLRRMTDSLNVDMLLYMAMQIAAGMAYLETKNFIHRDLAARNCLVGANNVVKVGDFGLARFLKSSEYEAREGSKYPVKWSAPEVINFGRFSIQSDIWSYGACGRRAAGAGAATLTTAYSALRQA